MVLKMADVIKRPEMDYDKLAPIDFNRPELPDDVREQVNIQIKYEVILQDSNIRYSSLRS